MSTIVNNYEPMFAGVQADDLIQGISEPIQQQAPEAPKKRGRKKAYTSPKESKEVYIATEDERRAVEKAQNANRRGRGHKKSKRIPIRFEAKQDLVNAVDELHFKHGRTKNVLYNEALELLVSKYANK